MVILQEYIGPKVQMLVYLVSRSHLRAKMILFVLIFCSQFKPMNQNFVLPPIPFHDPKTFYLSAVWVLGVLLTPEGAIRELKMIMQRDS